VLDGTGKVDTWLGIYSDYLESYVAAEEVIGKTVIETPKVEQHEKKKRMSYAERKEWETIEVEMEKVETIIEETEAEMESAGSDYDKLRELTATLAELNTRYEKLFERWSYLQEFQEA
jgi:ATP-binding cassette subfamily F protein uup